MHLFARTRARRVKMGTLLITSALTGQAVLWLAQAVGLSLTHASSNQEANLGFAIPTAVGGGGSLCNTVSAPVVGTRSGAHRCLHVFRQAEGIPKDLAGIEVGDSVSGKVTEVRPNLLKIVVEGRKRTAISVPTLLEKSPTEYEVGDHFDGKVHNIDRKGWVLTQLDEPKNMDVRTLKVERMKPKFEIGEIGNMLNEEMEGIVISPRFSGILIDIGIKKGADAEKMDALVRIKQRFLPKGKSHLDFTPGQKVRCWVVGTDEAKGRVFVSLVAPTPKDLAGIEVGDSVSGKVTEVRPNLLKIEVEGRRRTAISLPSLLEKSPTEYEVGDHFDGKVHNIDRKGWILTQLDQPNMDATPKVERMEPKFEIGEISNMLNEEMEGIVISPRPWGIFIDIGIKKRGVDVASMDALALEASFPEGKSHQDFTRGQQVRCWVSGTDDAKGRVFVSLVAPPEGGFPEKPGTSEASALLEFLKA